MEKSKLKSFIKRTLTALVLVPVVVGCIFLGNPFILLLAMLGATLMSWEWSEMVPNSRKPFYTAVYMFCSIFTLISMPAITHLHLPILIIIAFVLTVALILSFVKSKGEKNRGLLLLGIPYITIGVGSVLAIYDYAGPFLLLWFMVLVWGVDIGGYIFGCSIKGPKLAPKISPNKTWAGLIGGVALAVGLSYCIVSFFSDSWAINSYYVYMAIILGVIAQVGDLIESYIKRRLGLKDSSNLIPGHGGIFDRIDGLIFAAPVAYLMLRLLPYFIR